jgi:hypothetical protein
LAFGGQRDTFERVKGVIEPCETDDVECCAGEEGEDFDICPVGSRIWAYMVNDGV